VPQPEVPAKVRDAVEQAWFEHQPLTVVYRSRDHKESTRRVRIDKVQMDRAETRLICTDLDLNAPRELRLQAIVSASLARSDVL
jgi:predicted DNA-binding transcriptional regulator YafY